MLRIWQGFSAAQLACPRTRAVIHQCSAGDGGKATFSLVGLLFCLPNGVCVPVRSRAQLRASTQRWTKLVCS